MPCHKLSFSPAWPPSSPGCSTPWPAVARSSPSPPLLSIGLIPVVANVTNTIALCPGFLGGTLAQTGDLKDQKKRLWLAVPAALLGGLTGGLLLLRTSEKLFSNLVPFLILLAASLLALQTPVRNWLSPPPGTGSRQTHPGSLDFPAHLPGRHLRRLLWRRAEYHHAGSTGPDIE